jgi:hypothetical protein
MDAFTTIGSVLFSILSGGGIVIALSSWLGKVWANRILDEERNNLALLKEKYIKEHNEKFSTYKTIIDVISKILADLDQWHLGDMSSEEGKKAFHTFNQDRLRAYGYLGMIAPQSVMDAQDALIDKILLVSHGSEQYDWKGIRALALVLLNEIRNDIEINKQKSTISYNGNL